MAVVAATRLAADPMPDGRMRVRERHQADGGEEELKIYKAPAGADLDALLAANSASFLESLATRASPAAAESPSTFSGTGAPTNLLGDIGSCYVDQATGDLYQRTA